MANSRDDFSVLIDTSFLISLYDDSRDNHEVAKKYHRYFIRNSIKMYLSPIVVAEFHQVQSIIDIIGSGDYLILPFNVDDGIRSADVAYQLGGVERKRDGSNPKYKDDLKLIAQAATNDISFIITEDDSTLARYVKRLNDGGVLQVGSLVLKDGFDDSVFNDGQASLLGQSD